MVKYAVVAEWYTEWKTHSDAIFCYTITFTFHINLLYDNITFIRALSQVAYECNKPINTINGRK